MCDGTPFSSSLEVQLYAWADDHLPLAAAAIEAAWLDPQRCIAYVARVFRRIVEADPSYLYAVVAVVPDQLLALAPHVGDVQMLWGTLPGPMGWPAWVRALQDADSFGSRPFDSAAWSDLLARDAVITARLAPAPMAKPELPARLVGRPKNLFATAGKDDR